MNVGMESKLIFNKQLSFNTISNHYNFRYFKEAFDKGEERG